MSAQACLGQGCGALIEIKSLYDPRRHGFRLRGLPSSGHFFRANTYDLTCRSAHGSASRMGVTKAIDVGLPLLVFGGPYSNLHAMRAMRQRSEALGITPERVICTGDVVAYCAHAAETVAAIRDWGVHVIAGNCETQLAADAEDCGCGFEGGSACDLLARDWYGYARALVSAEVKAWMRSLPDGLSFAFAGRRFHVTHGLPSQNNRFVFESTAMAEKVDALASAGADIMIAGHAGLPFIERVGAGVWFNPGVIGMPANDGTPRVWYGLIEADPDCGTAGVRLSIQALDYDHREAAQAMEAAGLLEGYRRALDSGLWPSLEILPAAERSRSGLALGGLSFTMPATRRAV